MKPTDRLLLRFVFSCLMAGIASSAHAGFTPSRSFPHGNVRGAYYTDRLIVTFQGTSRAQAASLSMASGERLTPLHLLSAASAVYQLPAPMLLSDAQAIADRVKTQAGVKDAEVDRRLLPMLTPNDPYFSQQWDLLGPPGGINMPAAWDITTGSPGITVAVIDTGILLHPDLSGRVLPGYDFIWDPATANDNDPSPPDSVYGSRDADPTDPGDWITSAESSDTSSAFFGCPVETSSWHGTHVAGTIGAASNNNVGISGINWASKILPVRVLGKCGGYTSDIIDAIRWSAGYAVAGAPVNSTPAKVINLSLGAVGYCGPAMQAAIDDAVNNGVSVVAAAGNDASNVASQMPANCANVIAVAANGMQGGLASYSNSGPGIAITAPGGDAGAYVLSTWNSGMTAAGLMNYGWMQGTSMATPHVSGVISLMLSQDPSLTPADILARLQSTARPFPTGTGNDCNASICGPGILDAAAAVQSVVTGTQPVAYTGPARTVIAGTSVTIQGSGTPSAGQTISAYNWQQISGPAVNLLATNTSALSFMAPLQPTATPLLFQLTVTDSSNQTSTASVIVNVTSDQVTLNGVTNQWVSTSGTLQFYVTGADSSDTPVNLSASGLPGGATFDPATGLFTWAGYKTPGSYSLTFAATTATGVQTTETMTIDVSAAPPNSSGGGGGGGGGCVISTPNGKIDPLLPGLLAFAAAWQWRRIRRPKKAADVQ